MARATLILVADDDPDVCKAAAAALAAPGVTVETLASPLGLTARAF